MFSFQLCLNVLSLTWSENTRVSVSHQEVGSENVSEQADVLLFLRSFDSFCFKKKPQKPQQNDNNNNHHNLLVIVQYWHNPKCSLKKYSFILNMFANSKYLF